MWHICSSGISNFENFANNNRSRYHFRLIPSTTNRCLQVNSSRYLVSLFSWTKNWEVGFLNFEIFFSNFIGFKDHAVLDQMNESLKRLKKDCVDLFYLHFPDRSVPIEETLKDVNLLYKGKILLWGLYTISLQAHSNCWSGDKWLSIK